MKEPAPRPAHRPHKPAALGRFLARMQCGRWLYPLYAARQLFLKEHSLVYDRLPGALDGLRIAYVSDIHYGALLDEKRVADLAARVNALKADLVILGGDYGEDAAHTLRFWQIAPAFLARLGVCGVLGNHDRAEADAAVLSAAMRERGVIPLVNSTHFFSLGSIHLAVGATDDCNHGRPDYVAVKEQQRGADFTIYAPHSPDALKGAFALGDPPFFQLALCGHTHGGQICLGRFAPCTSSRYGMRYGNRYRSGERTEHGARIIISNGVGTTFVPLRLFAPPQYHLITLRAASK